MRTQIFAFVWITGFASAQNSQSSPSVITLTGSQRSLTGDYLPGVTLPSIIEPSSIATFWPSSSSSWTSGLLNTTSSTPTSTRQTSTQELLTNIGSPIATVSLSISPTTTSFRPPLPSNTQPCNNYVEFCTRRYSNITEIAAHNSPFSRPNNVARNQDYPVIQQLDDGIRVLILQVHYINSTLWLCHSSCDMLNEGTLESYLRDVTTWLDRNPFEVLTIVFGNYMWSAKGSDGNPLVTSVQYDPVIRSSGLYKYIYQPPKTAMGLTDWPTLGSMILRQKRVVTFIDYNFDTNKVPYMLWAYYNYWETPFSPTDFDFPCTLGRPKGIAEQQMGNMLYTANHNLNTEIRIAGMSLLVPNVAWIEQTNGLQGNGSLGLMTEQCTGRPIVYACLFWFLR